MQPAALILITISITCAQLNSIAGFWLTDNTLFQPLASPVQLSGPPIVKQEGETVAGVRSTGDNVEVYSKNDWLRVDPQKNPAQQQQEECRCNLDWLQNQTGNLLNKWLTSANFVNQIRWLTSNSTGASNNNNNTNQLSQRNRANLNREQQQQQLMQHELASSSAGGNNANHWLAWTRKGSGASNGSSISNYATTNGARTVVTAAAAAAAAARHKHQRHTPQVKQVQGERGPQGPKGEQGARGERGERGPPGERGDGAGLISVKDRNALFDLPPQSAADSNQVNQLSGETTATVGRKSLVFIEAEQMLVVSTSSGWRPVQLSPALRDFRKVIPKFTLSSTEDRDRLLSSSSSSSGSGRVDNSIRPPRRPTLPGNLARGSGRDENDLNSILNDDLFEADEVDAGEGEEDDEDDDDDDDDDDEEDDDEEDEDGDQDEDVDGSRADEVDGGDSMESREANLIKSATSAADKQAQVGPISARSATVNLVATTSIDNNLLGGATRSDALVSGARSQVAKSGQQQAQLQQPPDRRLKLRLAALNEPQSGNVHGIRGADFECKRSAARANIRGSFRAFLASGFQNLNEVVRHNAHRYPIVNLRNEAIANSWNDLLKQPARFSNPLSRIYSFDGRHVATDSNWPNKLVWHGASSKAGHRDSTHNCDGWHSDSLNKFGYASPIHSPRAGSTGGAGGAKRRQRKRHLVDAKPEPSSSDGVQAHHQAAPHAAFLDFIERYPCRMPLIVLCIETVGQSANYTGRNRVASAADINNNNNNNIYLGESNLI